MIYIYLQKQLKLFPYVVKLESAKIRTYLTKEFNMNVFKKTGIKFEVINEIINLAKKYDIQKIILFGSRARGDFKPKSDIDLAVSGKNFTNFTLDVDEKTSTLLSFDIVNLDETVQNKLLEEINKDGVLLYEKI